MSRASATEFECVVQPQQVVKLASPVARLDLDRGDVVHQDQIVGKLEDGVEAAMLALARARDEVVNQRTLRSPIDGVLVERLLVPGEHRNEQTPILTPAQIDPLWVEVCVPTAYYRQIRTGSKAVVGPEQPIDETSTFQTASSDRSAIINAKEGAMCSANKNSVKIEVEQYQYNELGPSKLLSTEYFNVSEGESFGSLHINLYVMQVSGPILKVIEIQDAENAKVMLTQNLTASANPSPIELTYTLTLKKACHRVGPIDGGGNICLRIVR